MFLFYQVVHSNCLRPAVHPQEECSAPGPEDPEHFPHLAEHYQDWRLWHLKGTVGHHC